MAHQKIYFLPIWQNNRYNFDSFTLDSYCCVGCCHFLIWQSEEKGQCPWLIGMACFKNSCDSPLENRCSRCCSMDLPGPYSFASDTECCFGVCLRLTDIYFLYRTCCFYLDMLKILCLWFQQFHQNLPKSVCYLGCKFREKPQKQWLRKTEMYLFLV